MSSERRHAAGFRQPIKASKSGFTLLEILIVVAVIALIVAIFLPSFSRARKQARRTVCKAYQYQLTFADSCGAARLKLDAFDCGCYGDLGKDLGTFNIPADLTEEEFRRQLEDDVLQSCRSGTRPAS